MEKRMPRESVTVIVFLARSCLFSLVVFMDLKFLADGATDEEYCKRDEERCTREYLF
jgi:hypothetical protein